MPAKFNMYDFVALGTASVDHPDPSIFCALSSPSDPVLGGNAEDYMLIKGANHYYSDQPQQLQEAVNGTVDWLVRHGLA